MGIRRSGGRPDHRRAGVTLLELAVVMVIIGVVVGAGLTVGKSTLESAQVVTTNKRMQAIHTALLAFRLANERIPCPADLSLTSASANYGVTAANPGTCTGGAPAANFSYTSSGSTVVEGGVPVRELSLPDEFMYDGWGRKFVYSVWAPMTSMQSFINYGVGPNCGQMTIRNSVGAARTNRGLYVLMSMGANGHGARNVMGQVTTTASVDPDTYINCHCDLAGGSTGYLGTYVQKDFTQDATNPNLTFDDIVEFKERWQLQSVFDEYNPGGFLNCPYLGTGSRTYSTTANSFYGSVMRIGDVNADGNNDLVVGMPRSGASVGAVVVIFGTAQGIPNPFNISALDGTNGFLIESGEAGDRAGQALSLADMNSDGITDIIIGAPAGNTNNGRIYVLYGHANPWTATVNLGTMAVTEGFQVTDDISSGTAEQFGTALSTGDLNEDGYMDIAVGAPGAASNSGTVYTVMGKSAAWAATNNLSTTARTAATGSAGDRAGAALIVADINADRIPELIVGMPGDGTTMTGQVVVNFGRKIGWKYLELFRTYGIYSYRLQGETAGSEFGASLASADVNGDYMSDLVIGAPGYNSDAGAVYISFGASARQKAPIWRMPTIINGTIGARITGINANDRAGHAVNSGDIDGDGYSDLVISAPLADPSTLSAAGTVYVMRGKQTWTSTISLSTLNGTTGFMLNGSTGGDEVGTAMAVGDVDRDYIQDILIGAPKADYGASDGGATYMFYGQRKDPPWTLNVDLNSL